MRYIAAPHALTSRFWAGHLEPTNPKGGDLWSSPKGTFIWVGVSWVKYRGKILR